MALVIAGDRSGSGKTTVTLALLAALAQYQTPSALPFLDESYASGWIQSFKVGPDYIDPMFHQRITGLPCRNLDPVLTSETYVRMCFARHASQARYALVEGVMGLFDGAGATETASTAHIARLLRLPVVLVLDCSRLSRSVAAIVHGYRSFDPSLNFAGVVLNRVGSDRHLALLQESLAPLHIPILGVLRRQDEITIRDRHLGLIPVGELSDFQHLLSRLAHLGKTCFNWGILEPLLRCEGVAPASPLLEPEQPSVRPTIAIAQDDAFNFYYADNLELLTDLGAELLPWSPLNETLPAHVQGLYFGGGFPEVFAAALSENKDALAAVRTVIQQGIPTYAECGGLMYLCQTIQDFTRKTWPMTGVLPTAAVMGDRLTLGYREAIAQRDTCVVTTHQALWGHEFHRSHLTELPTSPLYRLNGYTQEANNLPEGWSNAHNLHASYVHLHWGSTPQLPVRFIHQCQTYIQRTRNRSDPSL